MAKLSLAVDPTFVATVLIPIPGKKPVPVEFTFKGRTRNEFRDFLDAASGREDPDLMMETICGWELEDQFSRENVDRLLQSKPASGRAIIEKYIAEMTGARLGN